MGQLDWFEKTNINKHRKNKYPKVNYDEAVNFDKRFAEHLASKKNTGNIIKPQKMIGDSISTNT